MTKLDEAKRLCESLGLKVMMFTVEEAKAFLIGSDIICLFGLKTVIFPKNVNDEDLSAFLEFMEGNYLEAVQSEREAALV